MDVDSESELPMRLVAAEGQPHSIISWMQPSQPHVETQSPRPKPHVNTNPTSPMIWEVGDHGPGSQLSHP